MHVERAEAFLVIFVGNYDLVRLLPVADDNPVEVHLVDLEKDVVLCVGIVEHPLQEAAFGSHRGKTNVPDAGATL